MSEREQRKPVVDGPQNNRDTDDSRRNFTRLGLGAPVLMTLASKPVYGMECLSGILSGDTSHIHADDQCTAGRSVSQLVADGRNLGRDMDIGQKTHISQTSLAYANIFLGETDRSLKHFLHGKGTRLQALAVAALLNCHLSPTFVLTEDQLVQLLNGQLRLPPTYGPEELLEYIMPE